MAKNLMSSVFGSQIGKSASADAASATPETDAAATPDSQNTPNRLPVMILGKTLVFKGELTADEDMMLFGRVEGSITHTSSLTVGVGGSVVGDIHAKVIIVKGTVDGDLEATESITIAPTANVFGDISAPRVCIVEGAQLNGAVEMTEAPATEAKAATPGTAVSASPDAVLSDKSVEQILGEK
jgi:cytoskeletal protein CcmA (bactofilin family)